MMDCISYYIFISVLIFSSFDSSYAQITTCRCTAITNCADGTGGIDPRVVNDVISPVYQPNPVVCLNGQKFCCNLINPNLGSATTTVLCGLRRAISVPNYVAIGGQADFGEYPWLALIYSADNTYIGAGALIGPQHVITVAHKFVPSVYTSLKVRLGEWILNAATEPLPFIEVAVMSIKIHEGYTFTQSTNTLLNDIAIMKLATPVTIANNNHINSVCLPTATTVFTGQTCWVAGFGATAFVNGAYATTLKEVDLPVVDGNSCQNLLRTTRLGSAFTLNQQQFTCAGGVAGKDACTGDGGAPLVCASGSQFFVAGLVSWGVGCGDPLPGVYVNVPNYASWIAANSV